MFNGFTGWLSVGFKPEMTVLAGCNPIVVSSGFAVGKERRLLFHCKESALIDISIMWISRSGDLTEVHWRQPSYFATGFGFFSEGAQASCFRV